MNFFDLPHVFIVFHPGSGGNFISGLCRNLINNQLDPVRVTDTGSAHAQVDKKISGTDFLSFTTMTEEHAIFPSDAERINYYLENIKKNYSDVTEPMVTWTHDFTNISIYKKYFKNARILVITTFSKKEILTSMIMNILKTFLDKSASIPLTTSQWENAVLLWEKHCRPELSKFVDPAQVEIILSNRFNIDYRDLLLYASIRLFSGYYQMVDRAGDLDYQKRDVFNHVLYPSKQGNIPYIVGQHVETLIDNECITLPYRYLSDNDAVLLCQKLSELLRRNLTAAEYSFLYRELANYRSSQDMALLSDPESYIRGVRDRIKPL